MLLLATLHPAPAGHAPSASVAGWMWLALVIAAVVAFGFVVSARR